MYTRLASERARETRHWRLDAHAGLVRQLVDVGLEGNAYQALVVSHGAHDACAQARLSGRPWTVRDVPMSAR